MWGPVWLSSLQPVCMIESLFKRNKSRPRLYGGGSLLIRAIIDQVLIYIFIYIKGGSYPQT